MRILESFAITSIRIIKYQLLTDFSKIKALRFAPSNKRFEFNIYGYDIEKTITTNDLLFYCGSKNDFLSEFYVNIMFEKKDIMFVRIGKIYTDNKIHIFDEVENNDQTRFEYMIRYGIDIEGIEFVKVEKFMEAFIDKLREFNE